MKTARNALHWERRKEIFGRRGLIDLALEIISQQDFENLFVHLDGAAEGTSPFGFSVSQEWHLPHLIRLWHFQYRARHLYWNGVPFGVGYAFAD